VASFIVRREAQIGRKIPPFTRAWRERKVPASPARGRGRRCCSEPTFQWQRGAGPSSQRPKRAATRAAARPMLGQPKANGARAALERRSKGESERAAMATGPAGARGVRLARPAGQIQGMRKE
jgi:hypothetical protein